MDVFRSVLIHNIQTKLDQLFFLNQSVKTNEKIFLAWCKILEIGQRRMECHEKRFYLFKREWLRANKFVQCTFKSEIVPVHCEASFFSHHFSFDIEGQRKARSCTSSPYAMYTHWKYILIWNQNISQKQNTLAKSRN